MADNAETGTSQGGAKAEPSMVIVDIGKVRKSHIKNLRGGSGKLKDRIAEVMAELRQQGTVGDNAQPVVFLVEKKQKSCWACQMR